MAITAFVRFTIDLTRADKARWEAARIGQPWIGARPSGVGWYALPRETFEAARIGELVPGHDDIWWDVVAGQDTTSLAEDVVGAIERYAAPWLRRSGGSAA